MDRQDKRRERARRAMDIEVDGKLVHAYLVGGRDGVFAAWREDNIVHFAAGDDGHWWHVVSYDVAWIPPILAALECTL